MGGTASAMLDTYSADLGRAALAGCIEAGLECSQACTACTACTACADACRRCEQVCADLLSTLG